MGLPPPLAQTHRSRLMTRIFLRAIAATLRSTPPGKPLPATPQSTAAGLRVGAVGQRVLENPHALCLQHPEQRPVLSQACTKKDLNECSGYPIVCLVKVKVLVAQSCLTLCYPWTVAHQAPVSMGFSRQEYWSGLALPSPGDLPNPGIEPRSPALQADS